MPSVQNEKTCPKFGGLARVNEDIIKRYIEHQGKEDGGQAKLVL